ncbi:MAG: trypsin-like peptidase domain-containing protein [Candidatus Tyrphobacter sp.]
MVVAKESKGYSVGSAFCIASTESASYFLTSRHVVAGASRITIYLVAHPGRFYAARVIRESTGTLDAALLEVDVGSVPRVRLSVSLPREGQAIAIAGFQEIQIDFFLHRLGLSPSLHEGTVNALVAGGYYIEYDAQADHGDSGGPLFDPRSGYVYGIVTFGIPSPASPAVQTNLAISVLQAEPFIANAQLPTMQSRPSQTIAGAERRPVVRQSAQRRVVGSPLVATAQRPTEHGLELQGLDYWTTQMLGARTFIHVRIRVQSQVDVNLEPGEFALQVYDGSQIEQEKGLEGPAPSYYQGGLYGGVQQQQLVYTVDPGEDLGAMSSQGSLTVRAGVPMVFVVTFALSAGERVRGNPVSQITWHRRAH